MRPGKIDDRIALDQTVVINGGSPHRAVSDGDIGFGLGCDERQPVGLDENHGP